MTPEQATVLLHDVYLPQIRREQEITRRVMQAVPADHCTWKPDPKSMGALELAWHIASSEVFFLNGIIQGKFVPGGGSMPESIKTAADVIAWYDENFAAAIAKLAAVQGEDLVKPIDFYGVFNFPGINYAGLLMSHS